MLQVRIWNTATGSTMHVLMIYLPYPHPRVTALEPPSVSCVWGLIFGAGSDCPCLLQVVYEDEDIACVVKPPGMPTQVCTTCWHMSCSLHATQLAPYMSLPINMLTSRQCRPACTSICCQTGIGNKHVECGGIMLGAGHGRREGCGRIIGVPAHTLLQSWILVAPAACEQHLLLLAYNVYFLLKQCLDHKSNVRKANWRAIDLIMARMWSQKLCA